MKRLAFLMTATGALLCGAVSAKDWPIYRGVNHDGISRETGWTAEFGPDGPAVLWEAEVGIGFASFAVAEGRV